MTTIMTDRRETNSPHLRLVREGGGPPTFFAPLPWLRKINYTRAYAAMTAQQQVRA